MKVWVALEKANNTPNSNSSKQCQLQPPIRIRISSKSVIFRLGSF